MQQHILEYELVKYKERLPDEVHEAWKAQTRAAIQTEVDAASEAKLKAAQAMFSSYA